MKMQENDFSEEGTIVNWGNIVSTENYEPLSKDQQRIRGRHALKSRHGPTMLYLQRETVYKHSSKDYENYVE